MHVHEFIIMIEKSLFRYFARSKTFYAHKRVREHGKGGDKTSDEATRIIFRIQDASKLIFITWKSFFPIIKV